MNSPHEDFYIIAKIDGQEKHLNVIQLETTDGVPYYACHIGDTEITQLRNETYGKWEQLWGNLDDKTIQDIGLKIEEKIKSS
ncbi:MAG: hypothetical protein REI64_01930 [Pedobacter sp.]|uniref:hypothetical protein n=1 Tax=Pedobacter sp. TaxID=1411316 RepID=UPI0028069A93|nr:hypothetical protein [Pedobacter sp.]MDQ8003526.1 hypothetical protein [Pedobacter sp.]